MRGPTLTLRVLQVRQPVFDLGCLRLLLLGSDTSDMIPQQVPEATIGERARISIECLDLPALFQGFDAGIKDPQSHRGI